MTTLIIIAKLNDVDPQEPAARGHCLSASTTTPGLHELRMELLPWNPRKPTMRDTQRRTTAGARASTLCNPEAHMPRHDRPRRT